jgi:hypothetical protein
LITHRGFRDPVDTLFGCTGETRTVADPIESPNGSADIASGSISRDLKSGSEWTD